jgi:site-specific DNA-methyltransferase (adenine-specific)
MQLFHGDCLDILTTLSDKSVDAVICDPPYGTTACKWDSVIPFEPMWKELKRIIKPRGAIVLFGSQPFTSALVMSNPKWFRYEWVWKKKKAVNYVKANQMPMRYHENIVVFYKNLPTYNPQFTKGIPYTTVFPRGNTNKPDAVFQDTRKPGHTKTNDGTRHPSTIIDIPKMGTETLHPTQKPLALLEYLVKTYTNPGDTCLDFTFGSGTTGVACVNLDRDFIGIEKDATYFALGSDRINKALNTPRQQSILDV